MNRKKRRESGSKKLYRNQQGIRQVRRSRSVLEGRFNRYKEKGKNCLQEARKGKSGGGGSAGVGAEEKSVNSRGLTAPLGGGSCWWGWEKNESEGKERDRSAERGPVKKGRAPIKSSF